MEAVADLGWPQVEVVEHEPVAKWDLPREYAYLTRSGAGWLYGVFCRQADFPLAETHIGGATVSGVRA